MKIAATVLALAIALPTIGSALEGTNLTGAVLTGAYMKGAILCNTTMPDGSVIYSGC